MDITIIVEDRMVITDGEVDIFDFDIATNIHAVHWKGFSGEIEYNDGTENLHIDDFSQFLHITNAVPAQRAQRLIENQAALILKLDKRLKALALFNLCGRLRRNPDRWAAYDITCA